MALYTACLLAIVQQAGQMRPVVDATVGARDPAGVKVGVATPTNGKGLVSALIVGGAKAICFMLFVHWIRRAASRADWTAGSNSAINTAMMAITTSNSINVNPRRRCPRPRIPTHFASLQKQMKKRESQANRHG